MYEIAERKIKRSNIPFVKKTRSVAKPAQKGRERERGLDCKKVLFFSALSLPSTLSYLHAINPLVRVHMLERSFLPLSFSLAVIEFRKRSLFIVSLEA